MREMQITSTIRLQNENVGAGYTNHKKIQKVRRINI